MTGHYFILCLFAIAGCIAFLAALFNWDWFFTAGNSQSVVRRIGRSWARLVYGFCGVALIGLAIYFFQEIREVL